MKSISKIKKLTPAGIVQDPYRKHSSGAIRGRRAVTTAEIRKPSLITEDFENSWQSQIKAIRGQEGEIV